MKTELENRIFNIRDVERNFKFNKGHRPLKTSSIKALGFEEEIVDEYVVVESDIDHKFRVMRVEDAPYGICYSVGDTVEDAIAGAVAFGINRELINEVG